MTEPLTPPDCDLRNLQYMPLDVLRLRDSDITATATGDEFRCAVLLWCAAWHQVPAASLPDDDIVLSQFAGFGRVVKEWKKVKTGALRGWIKCSDGRLYHPVVAEKANESWVSKLNYSYGKMVDRLRKSNKQRVAKGQSEIGIPSFEEWNSSGRTDRIPAEVVGNSSGMQNEFQRKDDQIPAENALKVRERKVRDISKPNGLEEVKAQAPAAYCDLLTDVPQQVVSDWTALRKTKKATISRTAIEDISSEAAKAGITLEAALRISCANGWAGFKASWHEREARKTTARNPNKQEALEARNDEVAERFLRGEK